MARRKSSNEPFIFRTFYAFAIAYFMTYILGTILIQIGSISYFNYFISWGNAMIHLLGPAIGVAIAYNSGTSILCLISSMIAGTIIMGDQSMNMQVALPLIAYLSVSVIVFCIKIIEGKTSFDLFLIPILAIIISGIFKEFITPYIVQILSYLIGFTNELVHLHPIIMGMLIAVIMGMIFSTPITIVAITSLLNFNVLACGAALAGGMSYMIGLGLMSLQDNELGDSLAVLIGTPILQFSNILKHPVITLPPIISSLICGALSVGVFKIPATPYAMSMGGTALIGISESINVMGLQYWIVVIICDLLLPVVLNFSIYQLLKKVGYIKNGDLKIIK